MRTFTVVPSFEGESAYFELPDIGFQGDHLSFAILFNLTELTEHWPSITPSMIVTDPKNNTFIAPHTSWNPTTHIFTWNVSDVETAYEGYLKCQLKCTSADDPETIVCMSRICQTRVYQSLEAVSNPPEAFQTWIDTLVQLGAEISADASAVQHNTEITETNARTAAAAAEAAEMSKVAVETARVSIEQTAEIAASAQRGATQAQQRAQNAAQEANTSKLAAQSAQEAAEAALDEIEELAAQTLANKNTAVNSAERAERAQTLAETAQQQAESAMSTAVVAKGDAVVAQGRAEDAQLAAEDAKRQAQTAQGKAEEAQGKAETAQSKAEEAQAAAEEAQRLSEVAQGLSEDAQEAAESAEDLAKKWAIGVGRNGNAIGPTNDPSVPGSNNNAKHWSDTAEAARDTILGASLSTVYYTEEDESITVVLGGDNIINHIEGV